MKELTTLPELNQSEYKKIIDELIGGQYKNTLTKIQRKQITVNLICPIKKGHSYL